MMLNIGIAYAASKIYPEKGYDDEYYCDLPLEYEQPAFIVGAQWYRDNSSNVLSSDLAKICCDFSEWCDNNYFRMGNSALWNTSPDFDNGKMLTTNELFNIFRKK